MDEFNYIVEDEVAKLFALRIGSKIPVDFNRRFTWFIAGQLMLEDKSLPPENWVKNPSDADKEITEYFVKFIEHLMDLS